jgi:hypothetical protein
MAWPPWREWRAPPRRRRASWRCSSPPRPSRLRRQPRGGGADAAAGAGDQQAPCPCPVSCKISDPVTKRVPCLPKQQPFEETHEPHRGLLLCPAKPVDLPGPPALVRYRWRQRREVRVLPVDYGRMFPISGGPARWASARPSARPTGWWSCSALPSTWAAEPQPRYFPVDGDDAARLITPWTSTTAWRRR